MRVQFLEKNNPRTPNVEKYQGYIRITRLYNTLIAVVSLLVFLLFILSITVPYIEILRLRGVVHDNTLEIKAPQPGVVAQVYKAEGDQVSAGESLLKLNLGRSVLYDAQNHEDKTSLLKRRITAVEKQIAILTEKRTAESELKALSLKKYMTRIDVVDKNLTIQTTLLREQEEILADMRNLGVNGALSKRDIAEIKAKVADNRMKMLDLSERKASSNTDMRLLETNSEVAVMEINRQIESGKNELAELEQMLLDLHSINALQIASAESGNLSRMYVEPGGFVDKGDVLATVTPLQNGYEVYLRSSSKKIGKIKVGQKVKLWYEAFPKNDFGTYDGRVSYVGREPDYLQTVSDDLFLVKVKLDKPYAELKGKKYSLVVGSTVDVSVQLGKRKILSWLVSSIWKNN